MTDIHNEYNTNELDIEMNIQQKKECLICFQEYDELEYPCYSDKHNICIDCIKTWYKTCKNNNNDFNCPVCKGRIKDDKLDLYINIIQSESELNNNQQFENQIQNHINTLNTLNNSNNNQNNQPLILLILFTLSTLLFVYSVLSKNKYNKIFLFILFMIFFSSFIFLLSSHCQNNSRRISPII